MKDTVKPLSPSDQFDIEISPTDGTHWDGNSLMVREDSKHLGAFSPADRLDLYRKTTCELHRICSQIDLVKSTHLFRKYLFLPETTFSRSGTDELHEMVTDWEAALSNLLKYFAPLLEATLQLVTENSSFQKYEQKIFFNLYKLLAVHLDTLQGGEAPEEIIKYMSGDTDELLRNFKQLQSLIPKLAKKLQPETVIRHRAAAVLLDDEREINITRTIAAHIKNVEELSKSASKKK